MTGPRPKRIIFHLGFQKTGTTSIQRFLNENAPLVPEIDIRAYGDATKALRVRGRRYCATGSERDRAALESAVDDVLDDFRAGSSRLAIVSDENILGRVSYDETGHILLWAERILPILSERAADLAPEFAFYTRAPDRWFASLYNQAVKRGGVTAGFDRWRAAVPFEVEWPEWRARFEAAAGRPVSFLSMEEELASGLPLGSGLLRLAGVGEDRIAALRPVPVENASLSGRALGVMRLVNRLPLSHRNLMKVSEWVERRDRALGRGRRRT